VECSRFREHVVAIDLVDPANVDLHLRIDEIGFNLLEALFHGTELRSEPLLLNFAGKVEVIEAVDVGFDAVALLASPFEKLLVLTDRSVRAVEVCGEVGVREEESFEL
jgi:hypothetical protein